MAVESLKTVPPIWNLPSVPHVANLDARFETGICVLLFALSGSPFSGARRDPLPDTVCQFLNMAERLARDVLPEPLRATAAYQ